MQALDVPVLQMVEQPVEVDTFFRLSLPVVPEQVIEVPKLALPVCAVQRAALPEPQLVEQLVEVPTVLSVAVLQQRTAEQIVGTPVPHGRGGGARGGLLGFSQRQGSTAVSGADNVNTPVPHVSGGGARGGLQGLSQGQGSTAVCGAEHVDIPVPRGRGRRGGLQGLPHGQGSTASVEQTIAVDRPQGFSRGQSSTASAVEQTIGVARGGLHGSPRCAPGDEDLPPERFGTVLKASGDKGPGVIKADGGRLFRFQLPSWFFIPVGARVTFRAEEGLEVTAAYDVCFWG